MNIYLKKLVEEMSIEIDLKGLLVNIYLKFTSTMGTFTVGVYKRNVSPENHSQDTTLNDQYTYEIIYKW